MGFKELTKMLRLEFPEKFQGEKSTELGELVVGIPGELQTRHGR